MELNNHWQGKRVLVFGGNGFLGQHLVARLREERAVVYHPRRTECDLLNRPEVFWYMDELSRYISKGLGIYERPFDYCFNLAATVGGIGANRISPGHFIRDNLLMGVNVLDACLNFRVGKTIVIGTTCMYPKNCPTPFKELDIFNGYPEETNAPYGIAKRSIMTMMQAYKKQFGMDGVVVVPTNLYGPGDNFNPSTSHVIPAIIKKAYDVELGRADNITVWGSGKPTRDFLYVEDAVDGILLASQMLSDPSPINIGSGVEVKISDIVDTIVELMNLDSPLSISYDHTNPDGQPRRILDISRMKLLGWAPLTTLETGLSQTIEWFRGEMNG